MSLSVNQIPRRPSLAHTVDGEDWAVDPLDTARFPITPPDQNNRRNQRQHQPQRQHQISPELIPPSIQVRSHLISRLIERVHRLDLRKRWILILQTLINLTQFIGLITILVITQNQSCDQPLRLYLIIHTIHISISFPCAVYIALRGRNRNRRSEHSNPAPTGRSQGRRSGPGTRSTNGWVDLRTFHDFLCLTTILWFFLGNYFVFESKTCKTTSKELFYTSIVVLALGYLYILEVVFVVLAVMFYLPIVVIGIQLFGWEEKEEMVKPLQKAEIRKIPLVVYVPAEQQQTTNATDSEDQIGEEQKLKYSVTIAIPETTYTSTEVRPKGRIRRFRSRLARLLPLPSRTVTSPQSLQGIVSKTSNYSSAPHPIQLLSPSQSTCAICLADYLPPSTVIKKTEQVRNGNKKGTQIEVQKWETLRKLPGCDHCFHKDCIDPWLSTSARCPLCQLVVRLKNPPQNSQDNL